MDFYIHGGCKCCKISVSTTASMEAAEAVLLVAALVLTCGHLHAGLVWLLVTCRPGRCHGLLELSQTAWEHLRRYVWT